MLLGTISKLTCSTFYLIHILAYHFSVCTSINAQSMMEEPTMNQTSKKGKQWETKIVKPSDAMFVTAAFFEELHWGDSY